MNKKQDPENQPDTHKTGAKIHDLCAKHRQQLHVMFALF